MADEYHLDDPLPKVLEDVAHVNNIPVGYIAMAYRDYSGMRRRWEEIQQQTISPEVGRIRHNRQRRLKRRGDVAEWGYRNHLWLRDDQPAYFAMLRLGWGFEKTHGRLPGVSG